MTITLQCPVCSQAVTMPQILVRRGGIASCDQRHVFEYDVNKYYKLDGELRAQYRREN